MAAGYTVRHSESKSSSLPTIHLQTRGRSFGFRQTPSLTVVRLFHLSGTAILQLGNLGEPDWRTVFYFTFVSTIGAGAWMLFNQFTILSWQDLPTLIGLGVSATIAQLALTRAYRTGKTLTVASLAYVTVIIASFFGVIFWQEQLTYGEWYGIGLIILSGIISVNTTSESPTTTK